MRNKDTGEEIKCPCCDATGQCPHLFAVFDMSFYECTGGYAYGRFHEFSETIEKAFLKELRSGAGVDHKYSNITEIYGSEELGQPFADMWLGAVDNYSPDLVRSDLAPVAVP